MSLLDDPTRQALFLFWLKRHQADDPDGSMVGEELAEVAFTAGMIAQMAADHLAAFEALYEMMKQD